MKKTYCIYPLLIALFLFTAYYVKERRVSNVPEAFWLAQNAIDAELQAISLKQGQFFQQIQSNTHHKEILLQQLLKDSSILEAGILDRFYLQKDLQGHIRFHLGENEEFFFDDLEIHSRFEYDEERQKLVLTTFCPISINEELFIAYIRQDVDVLMKKIEGFEGFVTNEEGFIVISSEPKEIGMLPQDIPPFSRPMKAEKWTFHLKALQESSF